MSRQGDPILLLTNSFLSTIGNYRLQNPEQPMTPVQTTVIPVAEIAVEDVESDVLGDADFIELDDPAPLPQGISYSGSDFDVEGLVRRLTRGDIIVPTFGHQDPTVEAAGFQRNFVWRRPQMDKFVESLLLGFPVPGIVLVQQADKRYLVLDGQQRLRTLANFYKGTFAGQVFSLKNVAKDFEGLTYESLSEDQRRTLNNTFIQAIIVKTDGTAASLDAVYQVFERLNSGGTQLTGHEIRVALYAGALIDFIADLNLAPDWRALYGAVSPRLRDQELVLRIISFFTSPGTYKRPLKKYLNDFAANNRDCASLQVHQLTQLFIEACAALRSAAGANAFRSQSKQVNVALTESVVVGLMRRLEAGDPKPTSEALVATLAKLAEDPKFLAAISRATADEENVKDRLAISTKFFAAA